MAVGLAFVGGCGLAVYLLADPAERALALNPGPKYPYSTPAERTPDRLRVLFLGNSFTQFNGGLALTLRELAGRPTSTPSRCSTR